MTAAERSEMNRLIVAWNVAHHAVDEYVQTNFPFNSDQVVVFFELESKVYEAALKLSEFCIVPRL
ncbi:hypothetical protein [Pseudomonas arsenicoxydans]|uniref:Uncharacterized protein n=1 Tax=Pseudomonas arsenicoxydans TaxID=702115 RepID=A0A502HNV7_9PSED|nr:hypothetical protein [Pseudomonas arsenicoxydans]TPG76341.1 hypothetical protein EAH78_18440 [Pseudomonas arsenicoxydans]